MPIDHLIFATGDLATSVDELQARFGVRADPGGKHRGLGTHNALMGLGDATYLEIIAPDPDESPPATARPFGLDAMQQSRLAGWALACDDIDAAIERARREGYDPGDAIDMERLTPAGTTLRWRLTLNAIDGGPVPFLIDWGTSEHPSRRAPQGLRLEHFEIEHPDPGRLQPVLAALDANVEIKQANSVALVARLHSPNGTAELR